MLKKSAKKSGENLVNFFPAFYPAEYDYSIISDLTSYTVFSGAYAIVLFKPFHLVDIKIGKDIFLCRDLVKYQPFDPGTIMFGYRGKIF